MSRYPSRIPNRPTRQIQENKPKEIKASDLFKDYGDKNSKQRTNTTCEDYIRNLSVKNRDYTIPAYRNSTNNTFSTIVKNEELKEIRLVEGYNIASFPRENNRVEFFYTPTGKKVDYKEITKLEEIEPSQCREDSTFQLKSIGFTVFYQLYKYDYELRREVELCVMATR